MQEVQAPVFLICFLLTPSLCSHLDLISLSLNCSGVYRDVHSKNSLRIHLQKIISMITSNIQHNYDDQALISNDVVCVILNCYSDISVS